ncbi:MAG: ferrochelatase [Alphaproteobacteria bacterium]
MTKTKRHHTILPKKIGVLVVNLGSPTTNSKLAIKKFLREFLSDKRVVPLPSIIWQPLLNFIILQIRPAKLVKNYQLIWFKKQNLSPLHYYTDAIAIKLQKQFGKHIIVRSGYRYGDRPSGKNIGGGNIATEIKTLQQLGCRHIVVLPLYPHYSASTTASLVDALGNILKKMQHQPTIHIVPPYFDHPDFINLLKHNIKNYFKHKPLPQRIILSNHGIPKSFVAKGDPYSCQVKKTARLLRESLKQSPATMPCAFQSRFGYNPWVEPYSVDMVKKMAKENCQSLAIFAPSFAVDCIETLEEINHSLRNIFFQHHANPQQAKFFYIPCLNDNNMAIEFYKKIILKFL